MKTLLIVVILVGIGMAADCKEHRSSSEKREFDRETGYPNSRTGYVVDHIVPLKRGGCDCPANMQCQTKSDAKAKDRWE